MFKKKVTIPGLKKDLEKAIAKGDREKALDLYEQLEKREPKEGRWPHKRGELLQRLGDNDDACDAFELAVERYADAGFVARAAAMAKVVLTIDPDRDAVLDKVNPAEAQRLRRESRIGLPPLMSDLKPMSSIMSAAAELKPASGGDAGELKFADSEAMGMRLSMVEIGPLDPPTDVDDVQAADATPPPADVLANMPAMPLFADIPKEALAEMLLAADLETVMDGTAAVNVGDDADSLFVIVEGSACVLGEGGYDVIAMLSEGDVFGEGCLLDEARRRATVRAVGPLTVMKLSKASLKDLESRYPELVNVVFELLTRRVIANLLRKTEVLGVLHHSTQQRVAELFEVRSAKAGTTFVEKGKRADGLYVVLSGEVEITDATGVEISAGPGSAIGMSSLYSGEGSKYSAVSKSDSMLLRLPSASFKAAVIEKRQNVEALKRFAGKPPSMIPAQLET